MGPTFIRIASSHFDQFPLLALLRSFWGGKAMVQDGPTWQTSACPGWCKRQHTENQVNGDRDHMSEPTYSPAVRLQRRLRGDGAYRRDVEGVDLVLTAFQGPGESHPWISIGFSEEREYAELSIDSARRLAKDLGVLLEQLAPWLSSGLLAVPLLVPSQLGYRRHDLAHLEFQR
jgi:hypothetical protein